MVNSLHSHPEQWKDFFKKVIFRPAEYLMHFGVSNEKLIDYFRYEVNRLMDVGASIVTIEDEKAKYGFALFRKSDFDSKILNKKVGKVDQIAITSETQLEHIRQLILSLLEEFKSADLDYVTCRISAANIDVIHELEKNGFVIVDQYLVLLNDMHSHIEGNSFQIPIRIAKDEDIESLQKHIAPTFRYSRFFRDTIISEEAAVEMHEEWIKNSVLKKVADCVFVADIEDTAAGFVSVEVDRDIEEHLGIKMGHIPLIGTNPLYRGRKIGQSLTQYVLDHWFKKEDVRYVRIETQLINIPATRTYEHMGFRLVDAAITLRWKKD